MRRYWAAAAPGATVLVVAGNGNADDVAGHVPGPARLLKREVVEPFHEQGFALVSITESRFDLTQAYESAGPLAWVAVFEKPKTAAGAGPASGGTESESALR